MARRTIPDTHQNVLQPSTNVGVGRIFCHERLQYLAAFFKARKRGLVVKSRSGLSGGPKSSRVGSVHRGRNASADVAGALETIRQQDLPRLIGWLGGANCASDADTGLCRFRAFVVSPRTTSRSLMSISVCALIFLRRRSLDAFKSILSPIAIASSNDARAASSAPFAAAPSQYDEAVRQNPPGRAVRRRPRQFARALDAGFGKIQRGGEIAKGSVIDSELSQHENMAFSQIDVIGSTRSSGDRRRPSPFPVSASPKRWASPRRCAALGRYR